jgi:hypothetical protein
MSIYDDGSRGGLRHLFLTSYASRNIVNRFGSSRKGTCECTTSFSHFEAIVASIKYEASYLSGVVVDGQAVKPLSEVAASVSACASSRGLVWPGQRNTPSLRQPPEGVK